MKRNIQIQTTTECPGSCLFCGRRTAPWAKTAIPMSNNVYWATLAWLQDTEVAKLCMYFQNEPLADPKLGQRIGKAIETVRPERIEVSTNCYLLGGETQASLIAALSYYPCDVWLSFHGSSQKAYEAKMGLPWEKCLSQLKGFLQATDGISTMRRLIVSNDSKPARTRFWEPMFAQLGLSNPPDVYIFRRPNARAGNSIGIKPPRRNDESWRDCDRLDWICVNYKGDVVLCCMDYQHEVVFGNVLKNSFEMIQHKAQGIMERLSASRRFICYRCTGGKTMFRRKEKKNADPEER